MTVLEVLSLCREQGVEIIVDGGDLRIISKNKKISEDLKNALLENKQKLYEFFHTQNLSSSSGKLTKSGLAESKHLSSQQKSLWFNFLLEGKSSIYNILHAFSVKGEFQVGAFESALTAIIDRHEIIRTVYGEKDGDSFQKINQDHHFAINVIDLSGDSTTQRKASVNDIVHEEGKTPFDLSSDLMIRVTVLVLGDGEFVVLITMHHIISDGWSDHIFFGELNTFYEAYLAGSQANIDELPVQYIDYAIHQQSDEYNRNMQLAHSYWLDELKGIPLVHSVPLDRPRPAEQNFSGASCDYEFGAGLMGRIESACRNINVTNFTYLITCLFVFLHRYSGANDIVVGTPVSNRRLKETESLIGYFMNLLVIRSVFTADVSFNDLLQTIKNKVLSAHTYQDYTFDRLVEEIAPERTLQFSPVFQILFVYEDVTDSDFLLPSTRVRPLDQDNPISKYDLTFSLFKRSDSLALNIEYAVDLFSLDTIHNFARNFEILLEDALNNPDKRIEALSLLASYELELFRQDWNATQSDYPSTSCIHTLFSEQVRKTPGHTAVISEGGSLSYEALELRAQVVGHCLQAGGARPNTLIGVLFDKGLDQVVATYGVLYSGAAYLPLDTSWPVRRQAEVLKVGEVKVLLTTSALARSLGEIAGLCIIALDEFDWEVLLSTPPEPVKSEVCATDLAYVIFTSGSTGKPKGVMIEHHSAVNTLVDINERFEVGEQDCVLALCSLTFDLSVYDIFGPLLVGGRFVLTHSEDWANPQSWVTLLKVHGVTIWNTVPAVFQLLIEELERSGDSAGINLRLCLMSGDWIPLNLPERSRGCLPHLRLISLGGATEASIWSVSYPIGEIDPAWPSIPYGRPLKNQRMYVLNSALQHCPVGVIGDLYIGGVGVSRGYWGDAERTGVSFIEHPELGERLYKTGDLARYYPDGNLEFIGRADDQVKLRGFRIELGEIESHLQSSGLVRECVVLVRHDEGEERALVAYVVPVSESGLTEEGRPGYLSSLREYLKTYLPDYMIPSAFVVLSAFPLTPNGKVDRKALPRPGSDAVVRVDYTAPETEAERQLCALWEEVLGLERVGVEDNFFALGGDSILSIQIASRSRARGVGISIRQLFEYPTIRELARHVDSGSGPTFSQAAVTGEQLLLPIHREYFAAPLVDIDYYHQSQLLHVPEDFVYGFLEAFLAQVFRRHDAFRLRYRLEDGEWRAFYAPYSEDMVAQAVERVSLEGADETDRARQLEALGTEVKRRLNIERGPLFKAVYFESAQRGASRLLLVGHHLVIDGVSWRILLTDLGEAYGQWRRGEGLVLGAKTTSYQAWGERLQAYGESEALQGEREYWKGQLSQALQALPVDHEEVEDRSHGATRAVEFALDEDETRALLSESHGPYRTRIVELLLSGLLLGFYRWTGDRSLRVMMEGHGRESLFEDVDLSQTVGWFTSVYPLQLELPAGVELGDELSLGGLIKGVKESVRGIPHNGIGYGVLRHLCGDGELAGLEAGAGSTVVFNYLGQFDQQLGREELFTGAEEATGSDVGPRRECNYQLEFNGGVYNGRLRFVLDYNGGQYERETMERLLSYFADGLRSVIGHCRLSGVGGYTVSDFPLVNHVSQAELDKWQRDYPALEDLYPATGMQVGMLFHSLLDESGKAYTTQSFMVLEGLDPGIYKQAWAYVVRRHAILRTAFVHLDGEEPLQLVMALAELPWHEEDLRGLDETSQAEYFERYRREDKARGFEFRQAPLMRFALFRTNDTSYRFLWSNHHSLLDGWSNPILFDEVAQAYQAYRSGQEPSLTAAPAYRNYINWLAGYEIREAQEYWQNILGSRHAPTQLGIANKALGHVAAGEEREQELLLSKEETNGLQILAQKHLVTLNTVIQAAWVYLLHRYSGEDQVLFGETVSGRSAPLAEIENMVGLFINTVPVSVSVKDDLDLGEWLRDLHRQQVEREEYSYLPLTEIQRQSGIRAGMPLFESLMGFLMEFEDLTLKDALLANSTNFFSALGIKEFDGDEQTNYGLTLLVIPGKELCFRLKYPTDMYGDVEVERLLENFYVVLKEFMSRENSTIGDLEILTQSEHDLLAAWNRTESNRQSNKSVHEMFEAHAVLTPDNKALVCGSQTLSYRELNERANRLAHCLIELGIKHNDLVGICVERSMEMVIGILGILKAGGAYVPLDPNYPTARIQHIIDNAALQTVLISSHIQDQFPTGDQLLLPLDGLIVSDGSAAFSFDIFPSDNANRVADPNNLAYVLYTSGSVGLPKGVAVSHRCLSNYLSHSFSYLEKEIVATVVSSPLAFDATITTLFTGICSGKYTELLSDADALSQLVEHLKNVHQPLLFKITPAHLQALARMEMFAEIPEARHIVVVGGEQLTAPTLKSWMLKWFPNCRFINEFGPTETVVGCSTHEATVADIEAGGAIPIGKPIINTQLYVLGNHMKLQPIGAVGELYIGGGGVSRGYLNQLKLTSERFVRDPFSDAVDARLYKTGDLVRWHDDGNLEFIGRADDQVKLRGFRIELGEIESHLQSSGLVRECVVLVRHDEGEERALVAYVVPVSESGLTEEGRPGYLSSLREYLKTYLPDYMIPSAFVVLSAFPLTPNGKVDRKALPRPGSDAVVRVDYTAPETEAERQLCALWEEVLGLERVGVEDNFFALGGDSILSIQIASRSRARGVGISIRQLFEYPTIRELARHVDSGSGPTFSQAAVTGEQLLLPIHREYFAAPLVDIDYYHQSQLLHVPEDFVYGFLEAFLAQVFRRHDAFRLRYRLEDGEWRAFYAPYSEDMVAQAVERVSLEGADETDRARQLEALGTEVKRRLNIERGPLFKAVYFESAQRGASRLLLVGHHLVIDGVSWRILLTDLGEAYGQWRRGEGLVLGAKTTSYQAWGERLLSYKASTELNSQRWFWIGEMSREVNPLPVDHETVRDTSYAATRDLQFSLNQEQTRALLTESHKPYRTRINELLLSGLLLAIHRWTDDHRIRVMMESHGREALFDDVDLSQTVGWFTTMYPLVLELPDMVDRIDGTSLGALIKSVKESVRSIPHNGIGYGVLQHLTKDEDLLALAAASPVEVVFNYLGQFDQQLGREEGFADAVEATGSDVSRRRTNPYQLVFNCAVLNGCLECSLDYHGQQYEPETMTRLLSYFADGLTTVIDHCRQPGVGGYTVSDFPLVDHLSQAELDGWQTTYPSLVDLYPATGMQAGMLFHSLLDERGKAYTTQSFMSFDGLDVETYKQTWSFVFSRHPALRTVFVRLGTEEPLQLVMSSVELTWHVEDLRDQDDVQQKARLEHYSRQDKIRGFDFSQAPMVRFALFRLSNKRYRFILTTHHSILDGWSTAIIFDEVNQVYRQVLRSAQPHLPPPFEYKSYISWLSAFESDEAESYWLSLLGERQFSTRFGIAQKSLGHVAVGEDKEQELLLSESATRALQALARKHRVTLNTVILAAWSNLLHRYSGEEEVLFGETTSGRSAPIKGIDEMVGLFINTLPVCVRVRDDLPLGEWLKELHRQQVAREEHSNLPLAEIQRLSGIGPGTPLFESLVVFENYAVSENKELLSDPEGIYLASEFVDEQSNFGLTLQVLPDDQLSFTLKYTTITYSDKAISRLLENLQSVLQEFLDEGKQTVGDIESISCVERDLLSAWNHNEVSYPAGKCIHEFFECQVQKAPDNKALVFGSRVLSYGEVNDRANQLAHCLIAMGVKPNSLVGICVERSPEMVIGVLGILKAGGTYVPLDLHAPPQRLAYILHDLSVRILITQRNLLNCFETYKSRLILLDGREFTVDGESLRRYPADNIPKSSLPLGMDDAAYVLYTSGSTGLPKGVVVNHGGLTNYLCHAFGYLEIGVSATIVSSPLVFDATITPLFAGICSGRYTRLLPEENVLDQLIAYVSSSEDAYLIGVTPSHLQAWARMGEISTVPDARHVIIVGGEQLTAQILEKWKLNWLPNVHFINQFGPTETVVGCSDHEVLVSDVAAGAAIPIGKPVANSRLYVMDKGMKQRHVGVAGELYVGGHGVSRGYLNQVKLTAERYVSNPLSDFPDERLYKTGDLVRWLEDGNLEFIERIDDQVKLRGFRIELGEIEARLRAGGLVKDCVAMIRGKEDGERSLVAYIVTGSNEQTAEESRREYLTTLRSHLQRYLPDYMVPAAFVVLDSFPLAPNGKVDRKALPQPGSEAVVGSAYAAPATETEGLLCAIWEEVLGLELVGVEDNFFALGGDSILSIQVASRSKASGVCISVRQLFEYPTIRELAHHANNYTMNTEPSEPVNGVQISLPIHREFFAAPQVDIGYFTQSQLLHVPDDFEYSFLQQFMAAVYRHHDVFRLRYRREMGEWSGFYVPYRDEMVSAAVARVELPSENAPRREEHLLRLGRQVKSTLDIEQGPLFKAVYLQAPQASSSRLLMVGHHLVIDGVSWRILLTDLSLAYEQWRGGKPLDLGLKSSSYQAWGRRLMEYAGSTALDEEYGYWLRELSREVVPLPVDHDKVENQSFAAALELDFSLDEDETRAFLTGGQRYHARINELLLSALSLAFFRWNGERRLRVTIESHGREELFKDMDLSRTLGWFTSSFPLVLEIPDEFSYEDSTSLGSLIKTVKESVRSVPHNGIGYGVLRYLAGKDDPHSLTQGSTTSVVFNYLGQFDQQMGKDQLFAGANESTGSDVSLRRTRPHQLGFNGGVYDGCLQFVLDYNAQQYNPETIDYLLALFAESLRVVNRHCHSSSVGGCTVSDFPLVSHLNQTELERWEESYPAMEDLYPATAMQAGLLFLSLMDRNRNLYVNQFYATLNDLDAEAYKKAWAYVLSRHAIFRTAFVRLESKEPLQLVLSSVDSSWYEEDIRGQDKEVQAENFNRYCNADKAKGFDFSQAPLMRFALFRESDTQHRFLWTHHHSIIDGWSLPIVFEEIAQVYDAFHSGIEPVLAAVPSYRHYVSWLIEYRCEEAEFYWRSLLGERDSPTQLGITDKAFALVPEGETRARELLLSKAETSGLQTLARRHQVTLNTVIHAAWGYLLHRYSCDNEVLFGETVSGRSAPVTGIDNMVGLFINTVPVCVEVRREITLGEWLKQLHRQKIERDKYSHLPLSEIQRLSGIRNGQALFESVLTFANYSASEESEDESIDKIFSSDRGQREEANYGLSLTILPGEELLFVLKYSSGVYEESVLERLLLHMQIIFREFVKNGSGAIGEIEILSLREFDLLAGWNRTAATYPSDLCIHELFEEQVLRVPENTALVYGGQKISYRELNERSNQLAHCLMQCGVKPNTLVGICFEHSLELMVGILGILKASGAYIPIDPNHPRARIQFILDDSNVGILLISRELQEQIPVGDQLLIPLDDLLENDHTPILDFERFETENPKLPQDSNSLAYVLYTSGSTGTPKGVLVAHTSLVNLAWFNSRQFHLNEESKVLQLSSFSFDAATWNWALTLISGGELHLMCEADTKNPEAIGNYVQEKGITYSFIVPALLSGLSIEKFSGVKTISTGADVLDVKEARLWHRGRELFNAYGPTENTVVATIGLVGQGDERIHIGKPIENVGCVILSKHKSKWMMPIGSMGELYIGGAGLSWGYLNQVKLTAERFISNPYSSIKGQRLYKTGDLVRWCDDGNIEFIGRKDEQIKLRGYRIEIGEIKSCLGECGLIRDSVVVVNVEDEGNKKIVAYVLPKSSQDLGEEQRAKFLAELRNYLRSHLPDYMVPSAFVVLKEFPLTSSGKVDRNALPNPGSWTLRGNSYIAPESDQDRVLCGLWEEVLGLERVSVEGNFFDLGGNSVSAVRLAMLMNNAFDVTLNIITVFEYPTVAAMSNYLRGAGGIAASRKEKIQSGKERRKRFSKKLNENEFL